METTPLTAAERIAQLIEKLGISSYQFGKETGLSHQTISNVLTGKNRPSLDTLEAIAKRYPKATDWLLLGKSLSNEPAGPVSFTKPGSIEGTEAHAIESLTDQLPPQVPSKQEEPKPATPGYPILAVARLTPEEAVAVQLENARLKQELETQAQLIAELRADKGQLWKQNTILLEKKEEASADAAPLTDTVDAIAKDYWSPKPHKEIEGFRVESQRLQLA